jgi:hypothetical protein
MKTNKLAWISIMFTIVLVGLLGVLLLMGTFKKTAANPAQPYEMVISFTFLALLVVWGLSGVVGWILLMRRGYFADQLEFLAAGNAWLGCLIGIFLIAGLWIVAVLPGPFLVWFATTRIPRPKCPQCKNWLPHGATKCVNCDVVLPGVQAETPISPNIAETTEDGSLVVKCEKCQAINATGAEYYFFYGNLVGSEYLGSNRTRYDFKIGGSQDVFLCDKCASEFGKMRVKRISLGILVGMVVFGVGIPVGQYLSNIKTGGGEQTDFPYFIIASMLILAFGSYFWLQRQARKQPLSNGDLLAIKLRKSGLKSQGYNRFYTREQMRKNQLL